MAWPAGIARGVAGGQALSMLLAGTGAFSQLLARGGLSVPALQNGIAYAVLALAFGLALARARRAEAGAAPAGDAIRATRGWLRVPLHRYALVSAADVAGNMLAVAAYRFTSITSVTLLDAFAIPVCMVLSRAFMGARYRARHLVGVTVCLVGLVLVVLSDLFSAEEGTPDAPNPLLGDLLAVLAAVCYATANVAQEALVKHHDRQEFLFMIGTFGLLYTCVLSLSLGEPAQLKAFAWTSGSVFYLTGYALCLVGMYTLISKFLEHFDATLLNLSLLTSDFWAVLIGVGIFGQSMHMLYFFAFAQVVLGVVIYHSMPIKQLEEPELDPVEARADLEEAVDIV